MEIKEKSKVQLKLESIRNNPDVDIETKLRMELLLTSILNCNAKFLSVNQSSNLSPWEED